MRQFDLGLGVGRSLQQFFANLDLVTEKSTYTHNLHPYPAKFIPQIPRALLRALARPGMTVLDPMCGSGTTLVEAGLLGYTAIGVDLNPVATLVSRVKTHPLQAAELRELQKLVGHIGSAAEARLRADDGAARLSSITLPTFRNRDHWFTRQASYELAVILAAARGLRTIGARALALCAFSAILVRSSNQESETRWCAKPKEVVPGQVFTLFAKRVVASVHRVNRYAENAPGAVTVFRGDARLTPVRSGSVGLVITSPPYANSHDYYLYNKLRMFWLGQDVGIVQSKEIGSRHRHSDKKEEITEYLLEMGEVFVEISRVLSPQGQAAIVVADAVIRDRFYSMDQLFEEVGRAAGLRVVQHYGFSHKRFNSSFQRGFGTAYEKQTHVLIFSKQ